MSRVVYQGENMGFLVLGRAHVNLPQYTPDVPHVLISITDPYNGQLREYGPAELFPSNQRLDVLRLDFFDLNQSCGNLPMMTEEQAQDVINFTNLWKDKVGLIVVHCEAGIARSAGVAAGLSKWLNGDDLFFYEKFCPNSWVYMKVLQSIYGDPWEQYRIQYAEEEGLDTEDLF